MRTVRAAETDDDIDDTPAAVSSSIRPSGYARTAGVIRCVTTPARSRTLNQVAHNKPKRKATDNFCRNLYIDRRKTFKFGLTTKRIVSLFALYCIAYIALYVCYDS